VGPVKVLARLQIDPHPSEAQAMRQPETPQAGA